VRRLSTASRLVRPQAGQGRPRAADRRRGWRGGTAAVSGKAFRPGPEGYRTAEAYAKAAGQPWLDPFLDTVADSRARETVDQRTGLTNSKKFAGWRSR
jgi:hypothetical protein